MAWSTEECPLLSGGWCAEAGNPVKLVGACGDPGVGVPEGQVGSVAPSGWGASATETWPRV